MSKDDIIFTCIRNNEWNKLDKFLSNESDIDTNVKDNNNIFLINYVVLFNKPKTLSIILAKGARLDILDNDRRNILFMAIKLNYLEILEILLHYNKLNIGISLLEIPDRSGYYPLHYAVEFNNLTAVKLLLNNGANINSKDKRGYTPLFLSILIKNIQISEYLISKGADLNCRSNIGETPIHVACNIDLFEIFMLLIKNNANVNVQDYELEFTPLMYSIHNSKLNYINQLLKINVDVSLQDVSGNSVFHHCVNIKKLDYFKIIYDSSDKKKFNLNSINIDGITPLHVYLYNNLPNNDILDVLVKETRLDIIDVYGNSCLHLLIKNNHWKTYKKILYNKKLDIYQKNIDGIMPLDYINKNDITEFMDIVYTSYYNQLLEKPVDDFEFDWQKKCITKNYDEKKCNIIIKNYINDNKVSYPFRSKYKLIINDYDKIKFGTFTGKSIDVLFGLIHLVYDNRNTSSPLTDNFVINNKLLEFYKNSNIIFSPGYDFFNFYIYWTMNKLIFPTVFVDKFNSFLKSEKRFFICPIDIEDTVSHANYLLYDKKTNELEVFEPYGSNSPIKIKYNSQLFFESLNIYFNKYIPDVKIFKPIDFLPKAGLQLIDIKESNKYNNIGDPGGFCAIWCIWYIDSRLKNPDIPREKLVYKILANMRKEGKSFREFIRNYSGVITNIRDKILDKSKLDINMLLNDNLDEKQFNILVKNIKDYIKEFI